MTDIVLSEKQLHDKNVLMQKLGATDAQAELLVVAVEDVVLRHEALTCVAEVLAAVSAQK